MNIIITTILTDLFTKMNTEQIAQTAQSLPAWNMQLPISGPLFEFCFVSFHVFIASVPLPNTQPISWLITFQRLDSVRYKLRYREQHVSHECDFLILSFLNFLMNYNVHRKWRRWKDPFMGELPLNAPCQLS